MPPTCGGPGGAARTEPATSPDADVDHRERPRSVPTSHCRPARSAAAAGLVRRRGRAGEAPRHASARPRLDQRRRVLGRASRSRARRPSGSGGPQRREGGGHRLGRIAAAAGRSGPGRRAAVGRRSPPPPSRSRATPSNWKPAASAVRTEARLRTSQQQPNPGQAMREAPVGQHPWWPRPRSRGHARPGRSSSRSRRRRPAAAPPTRRAGPLPARPRRSRARCPRARPSWPQLGRRTARRRRGCRVGQRQELVHRRVLHDRRDARPSSAAASAAAAAAARPARRSSSSTPPEPPHPFSLPEPISGARLAAGRRGRGGPPIRPVPWRAWF